MLASLLPGLRELRTPLAIGWTWLAALWLAFGELIPTREQATGIVLSLYDAIDVLGDATVLGILTFIAYLLGSLLEPQSDRLSSTPRPVVIAKSGFVNFVFFTALSLQQAHPESSPYKTLAAQLQLNEDHAPYELAIQAGRAVLAQSAELESRLLAEKRDIFDFYDRLKESADLRINLSGAALALGAAVSLRLYIDGQPENVISIAALAGLGVAWALIIRGRGQFNRSRTALLTAVATGMVKSPFLEEWEMSVNHGWRRGQVNSERRENQTATESSSSADDTDLSG
jgi:hypothetical protein